MKQYLELLEHIHRFGVKRKGRNGDYYGIQGYMMKFDMDEGFPMVTTRRIPFKSMVAELLAFIHGATNAGTFRYFGTKIWDDKR